MVYGIIELINFAHGDIFMVGAFVGWYAVNRWHFASGSILGGLLVLGTAMLLCAALGMLIEKLAYKPLRKRSTLTVLITAIGVSIVLQTVAMIVWKPNPLMFPDLLPTEPIPVLGAILLSPPLRFSTSAAKARI